MFGLIGSSTVAACTVGQVPLAANDEYWKARASQLEAASGTLYSEANEGQWVGKAGTHVAKVVDNGDGTLTASCTHAMIDADALAMPPVAQHWITTIYVRDVDTDTVIHLEELVTRGPDKAGTATTTFKLPRGVSRIKVYAYCNQHDLWVTQEIAVG